MPEPLLDIINKLGLWGTLAWLLIGYAAMFAIVHGRWPISGATILRLLWRKRSNDQAYLLS